MTDEGAKVLAAAIEKLADAINRNHGISLPQFPVAPIQPLPQFPVAPIQPLPQFPVAPIQPLPQPAYPYQPAKMPICGCDVGRACLNVACPHRFIVTCSSSSETVKA